MFSIDSTELGDGLQFTPDAQGTHGVIEPSREMSFDEYQITRFTE